MPIDGPVAKRTAGGGRTVTALAAALVILVLTGRAAAEVTLPRGFTAEPYVTGVGFESGSERGARGIPGVGTLGVDRSGTLYLARLGARFRQGEADDLSPLYRIPPGAVRLTPDTEGRFLAGPPLPNPVVAAMVGPADLFVTTYDRDRKLGALYRMLDGKPRLFAGGTPTDGAPLLRHPEGVAVDAQGHVYVADRDRGAVVRLDPRGRLLDAEYVRVPRPRMLAVDEQGYLWIGADGTAETPFQDGVGQIVRVSPEGRPKVLLEGPLPAGLALGPGGALWVAQRRTGKLFAVTPDGQRLDFGGTEDGRFLRGIAFAPVTAETRRAGIAGDLFVILARRQAWMLSDVFRIAGPFDDFARRAP